MKLMQIVLIVAIFGSIFSVLAMSSSPLLQRVRSKVATYAVLIGVILNTEGRAGAQIPMAEDFYQTSGTFVGKRATKPQESGVPSLSGGVTSRSFLTGPLYSKLKSFEGMVKARKFDDIMADTKQLKGTVRSKYMGLNSAPQLAAALGLMSDADAKEVEDIREELAFQIEQLEDFSRSNRIVFFNTQDLSMLKEMAGSNDPVEALNINIDEALGYVKGAQDSLDAIVGKLP